MKQTQIDGPNTGLKVLVVCTGNICRSPAAAALLRSSGAFGESARITSAGTGALVGAPIDPEMAAALARLGELDFGQNAARQATREIVAANDLVLTASTRQKSTLLSQSPDAIGKVFTLREYAAIAQGLGKTPEPGEAHLNRHLVSRGLPLSIPDPYRRGQTAMRLAVLDILDCVERISGKPNPDAALAVAEDRKLTVMSSATQPTERSNPYMSELFDALSKQGSIEHIPFTWRKAVFGKVDVFHSHWPEVKLRGNTRGKSLLRKAAFWAMLVNFRARRTAVVQTLHNIEPHEGIGVFDRRLLRGLAKLTRARISINDATAWSAGPPVRTILHGHLKDWYATYPRAAARPGSLAFVGLIRQYKGVAPFLKTFAATSGDLRLHVAGRAEPEKLGEELRALAAADPRVELSLGFVTDEELVHTITSASLSVLPYRQLHNSGAAISALSLNRPVLVPDNASTRRLAAEVGEEWVIRYTDDLTPPKLTGALLQAETIRAGAQPDLSHRDWKLAGAQHAAVFHEAVLRPRTLRKDDTE